MTTLLIVGLAVACYGLGMMGAFAITSARKARRLSKPKPIVCSHPEVRLENLSQHYYGESSAWSGYCLSCLKSYSEVLPIIGSPYNHDDEAWKERAKRYLLAKGYVYTQETDSWLR